LDELAHGPELSERAVVCELDAGPRLDVTGQELQLGGAQAPVLAKLLMCEHSRGVDLEVFSKRRADSLICVIALHGLTPLVCVVCVFLRITRVRPCICPVKHSVIFGRRLSWRRLLALDFGSSDAGTYTANLVLERVHATRTPFE
jgi:hypothetical protein